jgi:hypothetical protein
MASPVPSLGLLELLLGIISGGRSFAACKGDSTRVAFFRGMASAPWVRRGRRAHAAVVLPRTTAENLHDCWAHQQRDTAPQSAKTAKQRGEATLGDRPAVQRSQPPQAPVGRGGAHLSSQLRQRYVGRIAVQGQPGGKNARPSLKNN